MPWYKQRIFILGVGILVGLLIGWAIFSEGIDIHEGTPTFSKYNDSTKAIELPVKSSQQNDVHYWVTSEMIGGQKKGLTITSSSGAIYPPHYNCSGGPVSFWDLPAIDSYQLMPLYKNEGCGIAPPEPTDPIIVGSPHTLVTKTGTIPLMHEGVVVTCPIDVYTFTDGAGNTQCITIVLIDR